MTGILGPVKMTYTFAVFHERYLVKPVSFLYNTSMKTMNTQTSNTETVTISRAEYEALREGNEHLRSMYDQLLEKFALAQKNRFGSKAEPASEEVVEQLSLMFDEPEATVWVEQQKEEKPDVVVAAHSRTRNSGSVLDVVPAGAEIITEDHTLSGEDLKCPVCGMEMVEIGTEVRRTLEIIPEKIVVHEDIYHNYACKECEKESDQAMIVKTPKEPSVIPGSFASPEAIAWLDTQKYVMGVPLYRQEQHLKRMNVKLSRQTMSNWMVKSAELWLKPVFCLLHAHLLQYPYLNADETVLQVLHEPGKPAQSKSYMWLYRTGKHTEHPVVLYEYRPDRKQDRPKEFLAGFKGFLQTDGYAGYNSLPAEDVTRIGCLAHLRRKFTDAEKAAPKGKKSPTITTAIAYCSKVFQIEEELADLSCEERYRQRLVRVKPVLEEFFSWAETRHAAPKSKLGEALTYTRNQKPFIMNYLLDGHLEASNNLAERSIKPFVIDRKNFLFANTPAGAEASAITFSIIETAKANGLDPFKYLTYIFKTAPGLDQSQPDWATPLLPWNAPDDCSVPS